MRIPTSLIEEAHLALRKTIAGWGKKVAKSRGITHREGIAHVKKQITVTGATGAVTLVDLYEVATAEDEHGNQYTKYVGSDGKHYVENHSERRVYHA